MGGITTGIQNQLQPISNMIGQVQPKPVVQPGPIIDPRNPNMGGGRDGRNPVNTLPWTPMSNRDYRRFTSTGAVPGVAPNTATTPLNPTPVYQPFEGNGGYFNPANQATINQDMQNAQNGVFLGPGNQGGGIFGDPLPQQQQLAPGQVAPTQAEINRLYPLLSTPMSPTPMPANYTGPMTQPTQNNWQGTGHAAPMPAMPQYGQQPQRGPAQRDLQPMVTQGLAGLMNRR